MKPATVRRFFQKFSDDRSCLAHLFKVRFGQGHICPQVRSVGEVVSVEI